MELRILGITIPPSVTPDIGISADWCTVLCTEMADDGIDTQVPGSAAQELRQLCQYQIV